MAITGVLGVGASSGQTLQSAATSGSGSDSDSFEQTFLNYMKESPAQRMTDAWLKAHHLTEKSLQALPPAQRDAIENEMAEDIKKLIERKAQSVLSAELSAVG